MSTLLEVNGLETRFYTQEGVVRAVNGISYHVDRGETLAIVGESGCGKSVGVLSLLRLIPQPPGKITGGEVLFGTNGDRRDLLQISEDEIREVRGNRIASHARSTRPGGFTTIEAHMPAAHRAHLEWTPSRLINWGGTIGPHTAALVEHVIRSKPHPEQGYRSALGILRLSNKHGKERLERACEKAFLINSPSYKTVKTMLRQRMESVPLRGESEVAGGAEHLVQRQHRVVAGMIGVVAGRPVGDLALPVAHGEEICDRDRLVVGDEEAVLRAGCGAPAAHARVGARLVEEDRCLALRSRYDPSASQTYRTLAAGGIPPPDSHPLQHA